MSGTLDFEVRRVDLPAVEKLLGAQGETFARSATRSADTENTVDSKLRMQVTLINAARLAPRQSTTLGIEVPKVQPTLNDIESFAQAAGGRKIESRLSEERGRIVARIVIDVPQAKNAEVVAKIPRTGARCG